MSRVARPRGVRVNKAVADTGYCSRREADMLVEAGRVTLRGQVARMGDMVLPGDELWVDGAPAGDVPKDVYIAFHKPRGVVCTADRREPMNIIDFLGYKERIFPVGRLDKDSEGLILLTNNGDIVNAVLRAGHAHQKQYTVHVDKPVTARFLTAMSNGVKILDTVTLPCQVKKLDNFTFSLVLVQGLNRQIRRMCEALGYRVRALRRERIMHILLGELPPGHWRYLTDEETDVLIGAAQANAQGDAYEEADD